MSDYLELPDELQQLVEKRQGERRGADENDSAADDTSLPSGEERRKGERRSGSNE